MDIINIRLHIGNGVDLAREERMKKYDGLVAKFKEVYGHKRVVKHKDGLDELGTKAG